MIYAAAILIGYVCGLFQTAFIYGKLHGVDIRTEGSGNAGSTNALRTFGKGAGGLVLLGDFLKCVVAALIVYFLIGRNHPEVDYLLRALTGLGCALGHDFPVYMNFKGGKGAACLLGVAATINPILAITGFIFFILIAAFTHYVSLASLLAGVYFLVGVVIIGQRGYFHMGAQHLAAMYAAAATIVALLFFQHRGNIARLIKGVERKTYISGKKG